MQLHSIALASTSRSAVNASTVHRRAPRRIVFVAMLLAGAAPLFAQHNLYDHRYWDITGNRQNQEYGFNGMDTLGRINDTIPHALSIGSDGIASYVYNRFPLDTSRHYEFQGRNVLRGNFNSDSLPDFLTIASGGGGARVLMGTRNPDSFVVAAVLPNDDQHYGGGEATNTVCVFDLDSDGLSDILFSDFNYVQDTLGAIGHQCFFRGGDTFDTLPAEIATGRRHFTDFVGGPLMIGHFLKNSRLCLAEARMYGPDPRLGRFDTVRVYFYPIGKGFHLTASDTLMFLADSSGQTLIPNPFYVYATDIDADGRDDILVSGGDRVWAFHTDSASVHLPFFTFHRKISTGSATFRAKVVALGDIIGKGYPSILITDPQGDAGSGYFGGTIFVYNVGKALKDSCVAIGTANGAENYLGTQAIALGDISGDGRADFMVGRNAVDSAYFNVGGVIVFLGDSSYGPTLSAVREESSPQPLRIRLDPNYPDPFSQSTNIQFDLDDRAGQTARVEIFDVFGRRVAEPFHGACDGTRHTAVFDASRLATGVYVCRLAIGAHAAMRLMRVAR